MQAPSNAVVLWSVPPGLRPFAVSMSIVLTHLLGDVPSPPLLGAFQGLVDNWRCAGLQGHERVLTPAQQPVHRDAAGSCADCLISWAGSEIREPLNRDAWLCEDEVHPAAISPELVRQVGSKPRVHHKIRPEKV